MVRLLPDESNENFEVRTGVKEGCVVAPRLSSIFISAGLHLVLEKFPMQFMIRIDGKLFNLRRLKAKTTHMTVLELQYADDIALVTHTE